MNHAQRITAATLAALTVITLSGCVWEPDNPNEGTGLHYEEFTTEDGRRIPCAVYKGYSSGGLSCDWVYVCPTCEDKSIGETEPAVPHCIQCGRPMNLDGDTWVCGTCCWTRDQNDHWSHDTLRLATRTLTAENQTNLNTPAEAYVVGFLAAWDKALELCRSLENQLGEHA